MIKRWRGGALQASLKAALECLKTFSSTDFRGDLAHFKVPTLIIHGTEDKTVPIEASARLAAKDISGCNRFVQSDHCGLQTTSQR